MQSLLLFASSGKSDPSLSIFLGIGAIAVLGIGLYALVKSSFKSDTKTDADWKAAAEALGFENLSAWKYWTMKGTIDGREVSLALRSVPVSKYSAVRYLYCQVSFVSRLGSSFSIEPTPLMLLQSLGGDDTNIPVFEDKFKVISEDLNHLTRLLKAAPEKMDGRVLADEMLYRLMQKGQRICLSETTLELAIKATDTLEGLIERIRDLAAETIGLADLIARRAQRVRESAA